MTTEAEIQQKSGANVNVAFNTTMMTASNLRAESIINCICRYNFSDTFSTLNIDVKQILSDFCSSFVAIEAISYDLSGYTSRIEAEDIINIQRDTMLRAMSILRDQKVVTFINAAT
ncbi:hypothetical protein LCGC14_1911240 [marine sediment metagenome]|uniref:Uncharacterized protein n=1 Tax=marine sediment metagenome TaxID=412755 RepID=A0A0F9GGV2_9ZZZZ